MKKLVLFTLILIVGGYSIASFSYSQNWNAVPGRAALYCDRYKEPPFSMADYGDCVNRRYKEMSDAFRNSIIGFGVTGILVFILFVKSLPSQRT